jgi:hypothetical protein
MTVSSFFYDWHQKRSLNFSTQQVAVCSSRYWVDAIFAEPATEREVAE